MTTSMRLSEASGRWLLAVTAAGSGLVLLEGTVVTVALPAIGSDLDASMAGLQWTVNAFTLTLSALILLGGGLGDRFGRRRVYLLGLAGFGGASLLCGLAPGLGWLLGARAVQGVAGALIVPGSLALIQDAFHPEDRTRAIGWWAGMSGVAGAAGPLLGGVLVDAAGWRWVFLVNVPLALILAWLLLARVPERRVADRGQPFDLAGVALGAMALAAMTYALTQTATPAWAMTAGLAGLIGFGAFLLFEHRSRAPMLPLGLFRSGQFVAANLTSFLAYGALAGLFFLLPIQLQLTAGYTASAAGLALLPLTVLTLGLSPYGGQLTARYGARWPLMAGSLICTTALVLATRIGSDASYPTEVLPVVALTGIGVPLITPPVTAAMLSAVPDDRTGIASAVNNGIARTAALAVVAALPLLAGLPQDTAQDPSALEDGFGVASLICAALFLAGGLTAWIGIPATAATATPLARHLPCTCPPLEPERP